MPLPGLALAQVFRRQQPAQGPAPIPDKAITDPNQADAVIFDDAQGDATTAVIVNDAE